LSKHGMVTQSQYKSALLLMVSARGKTTPQIASSRR
jgi:hypothetical protein